MIIVSGMTEKPEFFENLFFALRNVSIHCDLKMGKVLYSLSN